MIPAIRFVTLYIPLVIVGTTAIIIGTHVHLSEAVITASGACFFKTIVSHVHHDLWKRRGA